MLTHMLKMLGMLRDVNAIVALVRRSEGLPLLGLEYRVAFKWGGLSPLVICGVHKFYEKLGNCR